jgi:hypothetical protein
VSLTISQLKKIDTSAIKALSENDLYSVFQSSVFNMIHAMNDSEIDSIGELDDKTINIIRSTPTVLDSILVKDYSAFSTVNGGTLDDSHISRFNEIMKA